MACCDMCCDMRCDMCVDMRGDMCCGMCCDMCCDMQGKATVFAYGQTGAGKTFTMMGGKAQVPKLKP